MNGIFRACLTVTCLAVVSADWNSHAFLQNTLEEQPEAEEAGRDKRPVAEAWVPGDFAEEISRLRIPDRGELPGSLHREEDAEEEEEDREEEEEEEDDEGREDDKSSDESDDRDYHSYEGNQGKPRPYVVNYEVTETIPHDTKKPKPKGPVYPLPPPCPGAPPPTFPPPPPPSSPKTPTTGAKDFFFPSSYSNYDSYFPTSYMAQSHLPAASRGGGGGGTLVLPWTRLPEAFNTHLPGPKFKAGSGLGAGLFSDPKQVSHFPSNYFPDPKHLQHYVPDVHLQPIFSPQTNNPKIVPPPNRVPTAPNRVPRRASPQPQRVIVRYHRPAFVIRKIQQIGPGADALIIRQPQPRLKEVHIHHHHDPGPVIHVHKNDDEELLEDARFAAELAGARAESEAELEAAGHFAEPAKKSKKTKDQFR